MQRLLCGYVRFRSGFIYLLSNVFCNLLLVRKLKYILLNECSAVLNIIIGPPAIQLQPSTPLYTIGPPAIQLQLTLYAPLPFRRVPNIYCNTQCMHSSSNGGSG